MAKPAYRVLYNQDNSNLFYVTPEPLTPEHVDRMVDEVADGGADAFLLCPNAQRTSYPSAVWQTAWDGYRPGDASFWGIAPEEGEDVSAYADRIAAREHMVVQMQLLAGRCDYVERAVARCEHRGIAPGISIRMNDMHDAPWPRSHLHSAFYQEHPEWHLRGQAGRDWGSVGLDYAHRQVRDHLLALIGELAERYRFEVLELDFLRFAHYFDGTDPEAQRRTMTSFLHEVRDALSAARRPVALMARIASNPGAALELGFDVRSWAREGAVDAISCGSFLLTGWEMPIDRYRRLVGDEISVYACTDSASGRRGGIDAALMALDPALMRGFAAGYLAAGADGIELFNYFCVREDPANPEPRFEVMGRIGSLDRLRGAARRHLATVGASNARTDLPLQVPVELGPRESRPFRLLLARGEAGSAVTVEVELDREVPPDELHLRIDDRPIGPAEEVAGGRTRFAVPADAVRDGVNELVLRTGEHAVVVNGIEVRFAAAG